MATRKRKPAKRKRSRRTTKSRRRRGLGDVFQDRVREAVSRLDRPTASKVKNIRTAVKQQLCEEGEYRYCSGKKRKRGEDIEAAFANFKEPAPMSEAQAAKSETKAEAKGCVSTKKTTCFTDEPALYKKGKKGALKLRKGCRAAKDVPGVVRCNRAATSRILGEARKKASSYGPLTLRQLAARKRPAKGFKTVSAKVAKKKDGTLRKGCQRRKGHFECTKPAAAFYARFAKKRKKH